MTNKQQTLKTTISHWKKVAKVVHKPKNRDDYDRLSHLLDGVLDIVGGDEQHELIGLVDMISQMLSNYDKAHDKRFKQTSGIEALKFLMQQHNLKQSDLKEIGSQGVVSEILSGKRQLNINQIKKLAKRFKVSLDTFV